MKSERHKSEAKAIKIDKWAWFETYFTQNILERK